MTIPSPEKMPESNHRFTSKQRFVLIAGIPLWVTLYAALPALSRYVTYSVLGLQKSTKLASSVEFFLYDTPKVLMLLTGIVFAMGVVHSFFTHGRVRRLLIGKNQLQGSFLAATLGIFTPFCSCSAVPLFIGFVNAGIPLGVTFSFLVAAPMINEVALFLLWEMLGWKVAALYVGTGMAIAIAAGVLIHRLQLEHLVEPWVHSSTEGKHLYDEKQTWPSRVQWGIDSVTAIVGKVWPWVVAGIAVGAIIHGYVPENFMASLMGKDVWWSVPAAVALGIPMYSNAAGIIPIMEALLAKGAALGTTLAFLMAVIGLSLPEAIILRRVLRPKLLFAFFAIVGSGIVAVGYLFNGILG
jgi:uncharacterized membrane protein YraQ (UPF0718 family)